MAKIPKEKQKDIDIFADLGGLVEEVSQVHSEELDIEEEKEPVVINIDSSEKVEEKSIEEVSKTKVPSVGTSVCKFNLSKDEYKELKNLLGELSEILGAKVDLSHFGRGWVTRILTARKEIINAAQNQEKLKNANSRDPLSIAEIDHSMAVVQSVAFRRAAKI